MLSSVSDKEKLFTETFSENSNLEDSGFFLSAFPSRTNLKLHFTNATPELIRKLVTEIDSLKVSGGDCLPVETLKNCEPKLSYILAGLSNMCLKSSCLQIIGKFHPCSLYSKILGRGLELKITPLEVCFLGPV